MRPQHTAFSLASFLSRLALAALACLVLAQPPALAATAPSGGDPTREIFELSSLRPQLDLVGLQLDQMVLTQSANFPAAGVSLLRTEIARDFSSAALEAEILPRMRGRLDRGHATKVLAWLRSPFGKRVNALDTAASSFEASEQMQLYAEGLSQHPPAPERKALVERLILATGYTEATVELGFSLASAMVMGLQATQPAEQRNDPALVRKQIALTRDVALQEMAESSVASLLYTYRDLSNAELLELVSFAESASGRWYHAMVWQSAEEAMDALALRIQKRVAAGTDAAAAKPAP